MSFLLLLRCVMGTGALFLLMVPGCKQSAQEGSDTQGSGLSVGRPQFRDSRAMQAQPPVHTGLPSGPSTVKGQAPGRQNMNSASSAMSSPASGSLSASEYAQSLNQYAKSRAPQVSSNQRIVLPDSVDRARILARWKAMGRDAVQREVNALKAEDMKYAQLAMNAKFYREQADKSIAQAKVISRYDTRVASSIAATVSYEVGKALAEQNAKKHTDWVKAYNESHPDQPPVNY